MRNSLRSGGGGGGGVDGTGRSSYRGEGSRCEAYAVEVCLTNEPRDADNLVAPRVCVRTHFGPRLTLSRARARRINISFTYPLFNCRVFYVKRLKKKRERKHRKKTVRSTSVSRRFNHVPMFPRRLTRLISPTRFGLCPRKVMISSRLPINVLRKKIENCLRQRRYV